MILQFLCLVAVAAYIAETAHSARPFPNKITNTSSGVCPSEEQRDEARRQITNEVLVTLFPGLTEDSVASACSVIPANSTSGYYWIPPATGPPAVQVYCDFNRQCGCDGPSTWTRVAFLNMSDPNQDCPHGWFLYSSPVRACGRGGSTAGGCNSVTFSTHGLYSRVCGRVLGYQSHDTLGFQGIAQNSQSIDQQYLDGVSLTHGSVDSRQHIWSFASAYGEERSSSMLVCNCSSSANWPYSTSFVRNDYFCDSGYHGGSVLQFHSSDPLWDGAGCGPSSTCCEFNNPPWFCKTLPQPTTDDLEVRVCKTGGNSRDAPVQLIELYIQ